VGQWRDMSAWDMRDAWRRESGRAWKRPGREGRGVGRLPYSVYCKRSMERVRRPRSDVSLSAWVRVRVEMVM